MNEAECQLQLRVRFRTEDMDPRVPAGFTARGLPLFGTVIEIEPGRGVKVHQDNGAPPRWGHNVFAWTFSEIEPCPPDLTVMARKPELEQELERVRTCGPPGFLRDMAEEALMAQIERTPARRRVSIGYLTPEGRAKRIAAGLPEEEPEACEGEPLIVVGAMPLYALADGSLVLPPPVEKP